MAGMHESDSEGSFFPMWNCVYHDSFWESLVKETGLTDSLETLHKYAVVVFYRLFSFINNVLLEMEAVACWILWLADTHQWGGNVLVADIDPIDSFHELIIQCTEVPTGWLRMDRISFPSLWVGSAVSSAPMNC